MFNDISLNLIVLIFVLIVAMTVMVEPLTKWMENNAKTTTITN